MQTRFLVATVVSSVLLACSNKPTPGFLATTGDDDGGSSVSTSGGSPGDDGGVGVPSGSDGGSGGASGGGVDATVPIDAAVRYSDAPSGQLYDTNVSDAEVGQVVTLSIQPFSVAAGAEVYKCQQFGNPFNGQAVDIVKMVGQMSVGSHHFFVFSMDPSTNRNTAAPFGDCPMAGLEFHPFPYLSQQPNWTVTYPEANMGYPLVGANGLMMNVHYLNATSQAITAAATITFYTAKPGVVATHVGSLFLNNGFFSVPANTGMQAPIWESASESPISTSYQIFTSWQHMHKYSLEFQASINGSVFYDSTQWDEPALTTHSPYLQVPAGAKISWQCNYYNPTSSTMTFGDSAQTNVMCIYLGQYFPADPTKPDYVLNAL
jgi:hypothetical protein